ncbi:MAG TPA: hemerythrin domain-containing protein [Holophagaceae bacterium]|nr:hemerythrin domain-containing protein [Holophagaceae bacterium]
MNTTLLEPTLGIRHDLYAEIHKGVRFALCQTLNRLGAMDTADEGEVSATLAELRGVLAFLAGHLKHEDEHIHPAMEARTPGSTAILDTDHRGHEASLQDLEALAVAVAAAPAAERALPANRLYRAFAHFTGENLEHMDYEESHNNAVLWDAYTDAELQGIESRLIASVGPEEMSAAMGWMLRGMAPAERAAKLAGIRAAAPAPVFQGLLALAQAKLSPRDWAKLALALELQPTA